MTSCFGREAPLRVAVGVVGALVVGGGCIDATKFTPLPGADPATPTVPQPRLPQNDAYEGSVVAGKLTPRFVWEPSTVEVGEVRYELQYATDREFTAGLVTVEVAEPRHQPAAALAVATTPPVGRRYYWRVRACAGEKCSEYSRPWWVNLGRSIKDFNGDGYDDVLVGWHRNYDHGAFSGRANVYFGGPGVSFDGTADGSLGDSVAGDWFGATISSAGDFNGDGFADVLVGAVNSDRAGVDSGAAYLYFGGPGLLLNSTVDVIFSGEGAEDYFASSLSGAGDLNGDGYSDVVIGAPLGAGDVGCAYIFFGSEVIGGGQVATPVDKICGTSTEDSLTRVSNLGDINGDGFSDIVVGGDSNTLKCSAGYYLGGEGSGFDRSADGVFAGAAGEKCHLTATTAGDINGDGFSDVIAVVSEQGKGARIFLGAKYPDPVSDMVFNAPSQGFTRRAVAAGDINGDGLGDVVFGGRDVFDNRVFVHLGREVDGGPPLSTTPAAVFIDELNDNRTFAYSIASAGDVNGDGYDDLVFGDPVENNGTGRADLYFGNAGAAMDTRLDGFMVSGAPMTSFGLQVAQLGSEKFRTSRFSSRTR